MKENQNTSAEKITSFIEVKTEWKCFHPKALNWKGLSEIRHSSLQPSEMGSFTVHAGVPIAGKGGWLRVLWVSSACSLSADEHKPCSLPHKHKISLLMVLVGRLLCCGGMLLSHSQQEVPKHLSTAQATLSQCHCSFFSLLFLCAPQFEWGLWRSGEDRAAHLHLRRYTDGHPGEPAGDGGRVPGQAAQVSPPSQGEMPI